MTNPQQQRSQGGAGAILAASNDPSAGASPKATRTPPAGPKAAAKPPADTRPPVKPDASSGVKTPPPGEGEVDREDISGALEHLAHAERSEGAEGKTAEVDAVDQRVSPRRNPSEPPPPAGASAHSFVPAPVFATPPQAALPQTIPAPAWIHRGLQLRCDGFEGSTAVMAQVEQVLPGVDGMGDGRPRVVVFIPALNRHWPIFTDAIEPPLPPRPYGLWVHRPDDYPALGEDRAFDASFRDVVRGAGEAAPPPPKAFLPPRRARAGYAWAKVVKGPIDILGFTVDGEPKKRNWEPDETGEFLDRAMTEGVAEGTFVRL